MNKFGEKIKAVAFDLDGTLYLGNQIVDGAIDLINFLFDRGIKILYFTNNSGKTRKEIYEKLLRLGFKLELSNLDTSAYATALYAKNNNLNPVFPVGSPSFIEELSSVGLVISSDPSLIKAVLIGLDVEFSYSKLAQTASIIKESNCRIIASNIDANYPINNNKLMPGTGPIVAAIESACGKKIDYIVGKPNTYIIELILNSHNLDRDELLIVGDSYESDIKMAQGYGCPAILMSKKTLPGINVCEKLTDIKRLFNA
ncbi:MAG: HAD-IIA family hydrolase [Candidatus Margulisbacteria bacterium]|nr:HAD-IIA family hydrolase [Candidatus Margulisiibacteriota bacterium]